jgi:UDP-glucose 4-epimerase
MATSGEDHCPETHLIPLVLDVALGRRNAIRINGTDYDTPHGTCVRHFVHVSDLADAHVTALHKLDDVAGAASYNLGTGTGSSVKEVINAEEQVTRTQISVVAGPRRIACAQR